ncbi:hypothetical protein PJ311_14210 [Bacillus sp. CLL-7-23]|uniref:Uncharacterized protein n=1 Tax=Bacillus changyiensis TaxID=3004103 RepID=A0ABT4X623_9BACI|nr:hypothetical protein [Bacillus changyiensis]MDA7027735.1 hypothetical protein [Bacillus changyiensis]
MKEIIFKVKRKGSEFVGTAKISFKGAGEHKHVMFFDIDDGNSKTTLVKKKGVLN